MSITTIIKHTLMRASALVNNGHSSKILYYHDIFRTTNYRALDADIFMGTPLELFARHIEVIRQEGYEIVSRITNDKGQVAIMLDDGFRGIYECRDFFAENKICPTIFLAAGFIGDTARGIMAADEILELQHQGFNFECHSWSHRPLTEVPADELPRELIDSKKYLSELLDRQVNGICLPLGYFTPALLEKIKEAGYSDIYSSIPGSTTCKPHGMLPRNLCQYATPSELRLILRGGNELLKSRYERLHNKTNLNIHAN